MQEICFGVDANIFMCFCIQSANVFNVFVGAILFYVSGYKPSGCTIKLLHVNTLRLTGE